MIGRSIYYILNSSQRQLLRRFVYLPYDLSLKLLGKQQSLVPDKGLIFTGDGDYTSEGKKFMQYFIEYGQLKPHHKIMEVGSGIGRMAIPLMDYTSSEGFYKGFDIVRNGVDWCQKNISSRNPSFQFIYCDIYNRLYNSRGSIRSVDFIFPFEENEFDFVIITSVFTHMLKDEVLHYLDELSRVMKKKAKALITWFLLNEESESLMQQGKSKFKFPYKFENFRIMNKYTETGNVAYDEEFIHKALTDRQLFIMKYLPGRWCGRQEGTTIDFQDMMIIEKT